MDGAMARKMISGLERRKCGDGTIRPIHGTGWDISSLLLNLFSITIQMCIALIRLVADSSPTKPREPAKNHYPAIIILAERLPQQRLQAPSLLLH
jgi:hypothetical protein